MTARIGKRTVENHGVFQKALGARWFKLHSGLRRSQGKGTALRFTGVFQISGAEHRMGKLLAKCLGFPNPGKGIKAELRIRRNQASEIWERRIGSFRRQSRLTLWGPGLIQEKMGPFSFALHVSVRRGHLWVTSKSIDFAVGSFRIPIPAPFRPQVSAFERPVGEGSGRRIRVDLSMPILGRLLRYEGRVGAPSSI